MLNERELSKKELEKREEFIKDLKGNKRGFVKRYGKDAEKVMYAIATKRAKKQNEEMNKDKIREMIKSSLQGPVSEKKGKDMDGDGDVDSQDYLAARDAAIKKAKAEKVDEMDINDPVLMKMRAAKIKTANAGGDGNDKFFAKNAARLRKLKALKDKRAEIMSDMEQEAEPEGGPIADRYGDMLNKIDAAIAKLEGRKEMDYDTAVGKVNEMSGDKMEALMELRNILDELQVLGDQARNIIANSFPSFLNKGEAYGAFDMGSSANRYDTTLASIVDEIEEYGDEEEDALREGFLSGRRYVTDGIETLTYNLGYSDVYKFFDDNPGAVDAVMDWVEMVPEFRDMLDDVDLNEDLDLGHQDNEPHMLKADLYRIGKYAMELYQMVDKFEYKGEVDFPHWWQSKVIKAKDALVGAKHYLDFEIKEPQIDAMVDVAQEEDVIDEAKSLKDIINSASKKGNLNDVIAIVKKEAKKEGLNISDEEIEKEVEDSYDRMMGLFEYGMLGDMEAERRFGYETSQRLQDKLRDKLGTRDLSTIDVPKLDTERYKIAQSMGLLENARDKAAMAFDKMKVGATIKTSKGEFKKVDDKHFEMVGKPGRKFTAKQMTFIKEEEIDENYAVMMAAQRAMANKAKKDKEKKEIKEGTWSLGSAADIKGAIDTLEMMLDLDAKEIAAQFKDRDNKNFFYNVVGDDLFHDDLDGAKREAEEGNLDRAHNRLIDAKGRAEELLTFVQKRERLSEEDPGKADMIASAIQKAMNKHKKDDAKMYQLQKARTAMNKGDLDKAEKIAARLAEKLKSK